MAVISPRVHSASVWRSDVEVVKRAHLYCGFVSDVCTSCLVRRVTWAVMRMTLFWRRWCHLVTYDYELLFYNRWCFCHVSPLDFNPAQQLWDNQKCRRKYLGNEGDWYIMPTLPKPLWTNSFMGQNVSKSQSRKPNNSREQELSFCSRWQLVQVSGVDSQQQSRSVTLVL